MATDTNLLWYCAILVICIGAVWCQTTESTSTTTVAQPSTTPSDIEECRALNGSCETCVSHAKCMWCSSKADKCFPYPVGQIIPHKDVCPLYHARWGVCWVNYKVLLIAMGVLAIILLISFTCCIYCCCCRSKGNSKKYMKEEAKLERDKSDRKVRHDERRAERKEKLDEIRRKYGLDGKVTTKEELAGLVKEDSNPYERFDA